MVQNASYIIQLLSAMLTIFQILEQFDVNDSRFGSGRGHAMG